MEKGETRPPNPTATTKQTAKREAHMETRGALHRIRWRPLVVGVVMVAAALAVALWGKEEGSNGNKELLQLPATAMDNDLAGAVVATTTSAATSPSTSGGTGSPRGGESEMTVIRESVLAMVEPTTTQLQWKLTLKREIREEEQQEAVKDMSEDKRELQQVVSHLLAGVLSEPSPQPPRQEGGRSATFVHVMDQPTRRKVTSRFSRSGSSTGSSTTSKEPVLRDWFVYEVKVETSTETFLHFYRLLLEGMLRGLSLPGPDHTQWYVLSAHLLEVEDKPPGQLDSLLFILGATLLLALFVFGLSFLCGSLSGRRQHQPPKQD